MFDLKSDMSPIQRMTREDFFVERLKLLMVMCRAFINDYPVTGYRKEAVLNNAGKVFFEITDWSGQYINVREKASSILGIKPDNYFYQRVKLLALMAKSFAEGNPIGYFRAKAVEETIDQIEEILKLKKTDISKIPVVNVA